MCRAVHLRLFATSLLSHTTTSSMHIFFHKLYCDDLILTSHLNGYTRTTHLEFVTISFFLSFTFGGFDTDFFVILLQGGQILTSFGEFTFFHTFTDVPVDEGTLGV